MSRCRSRNTARIRPIRDGAASGWAQRLKRVFSIEIEKCEQCGSKVKIISSIEEPDVLEKILKHLGLDEDSQAGNRSPPTSLKGRPSALLDPIF